MGNRTAKEQFEKLLRPCFYDTSLEIKIWGWRQKSLKVQFQIRPVKLVVVK